MRALLIAIIIAVQCFLAWRYWSDSKACCGYSTASSTVSEVTNKVTPVAVATTAAVTATKKVTGPLLFNWSEGNTITDNTWPARNKSILDGLKNGQKLEITGLYRSDENNNTKFENLGVARANETRKLFSELKDDRVILLGKQVNDKVDQSGPFASTRFANRTVNKSMTETAESTQIYFPYNSTKKLDDRTIGKYLDDAAKRVIASGEKITLIGHTDDRGDSASNITLGQYRADILKRYLISKGVSASKIRSTSAGEKSPVATNATKAGRAKNRRTELKIN